MFIFQFVELGRITSIEVNHKTVDIARKGQEVCIKIENIPGETPKLYGRHFDHTDMLMSKVSVWPWDDKTALCIACDICRLLITFANGLDPDQDRQCVGLDLDPNGLTLQ